MNSTWVPRGAPIHEGAPILGAFRYSIDFQINLFYLFAKILLYFSQKLFIYGSLCITFSLIF